MKPVHKCWLCLVHEWDPSTERPRFVRYDLYSTEPWNTTNMGCYLSALYVTTAESYHEAHLAMLRGISYMATLQPFWAAIRDGLAEAGRYEQLHLDPQTGEKR